MACNRDGENLPETRFSRPLPPANLIQRHQLLQRMQRGLYRPVTLISAPPGYGKTILVGTWLEVCGCTSAWLSVDAGDGDLFTFLGHFIAVINTRFPGSLSQTLALSRTSRPPPLQVIAAQLLNELDGISQRFVVVLDDYHRVSDPAVDELLRELLHHSPKSMHLVLCTRCDPDLPLASLRAHGQITEIRTQDLCFTADELAAYLQHAVVQPLHAGILAMLQERTEGWIASVRMAAQALNEVDDPASVQALTADLAGRRYGMRDLFEEAMARLPRTVRDFVVKTSILRRLSGPVCEAITEHPPMQGSGLVWLEWLERANLFFVPLDSRKQWFRYHHLFREYLEQRLASDYPASEISVLHTKACTWYANNSLLAEALHHAAASGDEATAVHLIITQRHEAMSREQWPVLERMLELVPRQLVEARPELLLLETWILYRHHRLAEIATHLDHMEALLQQQSLPSRARHSFTGETNALRSVQYLWEAKPEQSVQAARLALAMTPIELPFVRGLASAHLAGALFTSGDQRGAFEALNEGLSEGQMNNGAVSLQSLVAFAFIHWTAADPRALLQTATYLLTLANERDLLESIAWAHYLQGCAYYMLNELGSAERCFAAVVSMEHDANAFTFVQASFGLASTYLAQSLFQQAQAQIESLMGYAVEASDPRLQAEVQIFQSYVTPRQGMAVAARRGDFEAHLAAVPEFHNPLVTQIKILLSLGTPTSLRQAFSLLAQLRQIAEITHNTRLLIETLALQALLWDAQDDEAQALRLLADAVALAQTGGAIRLFVDLGPRIASLLRHLSSGSSASEFVRQLLAAAPTPDPGQGSAKRAELIEPLSHRELAVLALLRERLSNEEIGEELGISTQTVKRHTMNIYQKLLVQGRHEAVAKALSLGILSEFARPGQRL